MDISDILQTERRVYLENIKTQALSSQDNPNQIVAKVSSLFQLNLNILVCERDD